jgi:methylmalonyl-CoA mutase cobalamin-binding subunit
MILTRTEETARAFAAERNQTYGRTPFAGGFYVGSIEELRAIGAAEVFGPRTPVHECSICLHRYFANETPDGETMEAPAVKP